MGWGICIEQDDNGFIQIPEIDFYTTEADYEDVPPHAYDVVYKNMQRYHSEIDMAMDEGSPEFARETAQESFDCAKGYIYDEDDEIILHKEKVKELKKSIKDINALITENKPLIKQTKDEIDTELLRQSVTIKNIEKEMDDLKSKLETKNKEYEKLVAPIMALEEKLKSYECVKKEKTLLQKLLDRENEWRKNIMN
jgi:hypothetical protein